RYSVRAIVWSNHAGRCVVGPAAGRFSWTERVCHLFDLGCFAGNQLLLRSLSFALLFTRNSRSLATQLVRTEARLVAGLVHFFTCPARPLGPGRISTHLLLLSWRLLQGLLG